MQFLDYPDNLSNEKYFFNSDYLNYKGADIFTKMLIRDFN